MKRVLMMTGFFTVAALSGAQPSSDLWEFWSEHNPESEVSVDHSAWNGFLERYVVTGDPGGVNLVRYDAVTAADRAALDAYIEMLESVRPRTLNRDEQMAYWINFYNALTIKVIVDHYPVDSIRDIKLSRGLFASGPWQAKLVQIEGQDVSLDDMEHRILRPVWQDPRVHYAVNCASIGCPNLQPVAFTPINLNELLDLGARQYVNHPRGVSLEGGRLTMSSIYSWFSEDFGGESGAIEHAASYLESNAAELRAVSGRVRYDYDWSLNDG